jgi:ABC-2 type transport system ATP-binding protein
MYAVEVKNLVKKYGDFAAVNGVSFSVEEREVFGIIGPNGAGKTTTLEIIEGLRKPNSGQVFIKGESVWPNPNKTKKLIGVQLQTTALFDYQTTEEMLSLFASFYKIDLSKKDRDELLVTVGLTDKRKSFVAELSGGQQQRLSIALGLVNDPQILFLDEPTTGLDPQARRHLWDVVEEISQAGKTIIITTHYMEEAEQLCKRVAIMDSGKIISMDSPKNLIQSLGADSKITFKTSKHLDIAELDKLPSATKITSMDGGYTLYSSSVQNTVLGLFKHADKNGAQIDNLQVAGADLEDVFLSITGKDLRD